MNTINLDRYMPQLTTIYSFYRYSEYTFQDKSLRQRIIEQEYESLYESLLSFVTVDPERPEEFKKLFQEKIHKKVTDDIDTGLAVLRRQILEASHSILEKYLCHVVLVYLHTFPQILMNIEKQLPYRTIAELRYNVSIFDHIIEKEVNHFSRRSLQEKKDYLAKHLKHTRQDEVWTFEGKEFWKDIDRKRQAIVHGEEIPEISHEYLLKAINRLQAIMFGIAVFAQVDQGIRFTWAEMSAEMKCKEKPTLKS